MNIMLEIKFCSTIRQSKEMLCERRTTSKKNLQLEENLYNFINQL